MPSLVSQITSWPGAAFSSFAAAPRVCSSFMMQVVACKHAPYSCCAASGMMHKSWRAPSASPCCIWYSRACSMFDGLCQ